MENFEGVPPNGRHQFKGWFDVRFIKQVVKEVEAGLPVGLALSKYGISRSALYKWIKQHSVEGARPIRRRDLCVQDKRSVVRSVNAGRLSVKEAAVAYRISEDSVRRWIRENKLENEELSSSNQEQLSKKSTKEQAGAGQDRARQLEQQLAEAQLKIAALNTLIDVAEEQLKINIRKKPGARQS